MLSILKRVQCHLMIVGNDPEENCEALSSLDKQEPSAVIS